MSEVVECPQCGATTQNSSRTCLYCKAEFFVTSVAYLASFDTTGIQKYLKHYLKLTKISPDNVEFRIGLALCYVQQGLYSQALKEFKIIIDESPDIGLSYYYKSLSIIAGRRVMSLNLKEVREIEENIRHATALDGLKPQYQLLLAIIKHDYYLTNGMKICPPTYSEILNEINWKNLDVNETTRLKQSLKVPDFKIFNI